MKSRREFIETTCKACIGTLVISVFAPGLSGCKTIAVIQTEMDGNQIKIPAISFADKKIQIIRSSKLNDDILLVKNSEVQYTALLMRCTHRNNPLNASESGLYCSAHGSRFDLDGNVTYEPASQPLKKFTTQLQNDLIIINL
ncbi:MAG TPA: Rieske (2Fe-2S) protein [Bacteroidia bacterium]|nr:Rieske (2Fe-2S) protein [Bacteroidia bacterium]